ncbi:DNA primase [Mameliella alba]|nr:DNA primase [Antarctobacter heliothermus]MBY6145878.1 DNA primase [Mameliella alba]MBY6161200.1 DNA primase [Mameliella alba]MBY6169670.1 DNA primase [Mameliella alba]MBY6174689.1 DNA primase [Mameliella alba]
MMYPAQTQMPQTSRETEKFLGMVEDVRNCTQGDAVPEMLRTAAAMVEHAAYVMTRHAEGAPVTQLILLAAEIESISVRMQPEGAAV